MRLIQSGPRNAKIVIVGEAPGANEDLRGEPFIGGAGAELSDMLRKVGINRDACFITNVVHKRPPDNDFDWFRLSEDNFVHYMAGVIQLKADLEAIRPNLVIAFGAAALKALTGKDSIEKWRGSILESTLVPGLKVIATWHPAFILRVYDYKAVAMLDLRRCKREAATPEIKHPYRKIYIPDNKSWIRSPNDMVGYKANTWVLGDDFEDRASIVKALLSASWLAVDIETFKIAEGVWRIRTVQFSDMAHRALVLRWDDPRERDWIIQLCTSDSQKVLHNGMYDAYMLHENGVELRGFGQVTWSSKSVPLDATPMRVALGWDTMTTFHALNPESASGSDEISKQGGKARKAALARGLSFLTSVYTDEPYYKDDGKRWAETGDINTFYRYGGLDACVTYEIFEQQRDEVRLAKVEHVRQNAQLLVLPLLAATRRGIRIDHEVKRQLGESYAARKTKHQYDIDNIAGRPINLNSPKQIQDLLYRQLGLPIKRHRGTDTITTDKDALVALSERHPHPAIDAILLFREADKLDGTYIRVPIGPDGRFRCSYDTAGTNTFRLSSRSAYDDTGNNFQNQPDEIRQMYVADPGYVLIQRDYSQAELWIVAHRSGEVAMIEALADPTRNIHKENAARIFNKPIELISKDSEEYFLVKRVGHGSNYGIGDDTMAETINEFYEATGIRVTPQQCAKLRALYFMLYPGIVSNYWRQVTEELRRTRRLVNSFGYPRTFHGRWDEKLKRTAYAYDPQSTVGILGRLAIIACFFDIEVAIPELGAQFLGQVHDSIVMQAPIKSVVAVAKAMERVMAVPITINGRTFTIPSDCAVGLNWGKASKDNPNGLMDLDKWLATNPGATAQAMTVTSV